MFFPGRSDGTGRVKEDDRPGPDTSLKFFTNHTFFEKETNWQNDLSKPSVVD